MLLRLYRKGKCYVSSSLVTYVLKNRSNEKRYGITTSKKIGKAVQRNRARRVIRASLYDLYSDIIPGYDIVFVARGKTLCKKWCCKERNDWSSEKSEGFEDCVNNEKDFYSSY